MDPWVVWPTIAALGAVTIATRGAFILFFVDLRLPAIVQKALRYVPPAVFAALVIPELLLAQGSLNVAPSNPKLAAGLVATLVAWRTRNTLLTILSGMVILHLARHLTGP
jgi:branched-subunit amino acid transport protein